MKKPFIIAEMSGNHKHSIETAMAIVDGVAKSGATAIKLQTYTPDTMTINLNEREFYISDSSSPWFGRSLYDLYEEAHTPWEWHKPIFERCKELGIIAFSTPFDFTAVDFLESLNVPLYKVASFENTDLPLIKYIAKTGKPMIISTGMATLGEIEEAVLAAREGGCKDLTILKCTSSYPAPASATNLNAIPLLKKLFKCKVGLSDHTIGSAVAVGAIAKGATVIEKHVKLASAGKSVDSDFSISIEELVKFVEDINLCSEALGEAKVGASSAERSSLIFRRSLYITKDINKGEEFTRQNLRRIRPGLGLPPKYEDQFIGRRAACDIKRGTAANWSFLGTK